MGRMLKQDVREKPAGNSRDREEPKLSAGPGKSAARIHTCMWV